MQNAFISWRFLSVFCKLLAKWKLLTKTPFWALFFFLLVSRKCLKTHEKCIHFKTFFARRLESFGKVKIVYKNTVFCTFFSNLPQQSVSKREQNAFISRRFLPGFYPHLPKWKLLTKTPSLARFFFFYFSSQIVSKRIKNAFSWKRFLTVFCSHLPKWKLLTKTRFLARLFKVVSRKCLKMHIKCIHFKTVFACVFETRCEDKFEKHL